MGRVPRGALRAAQLPRSFGERTVCLSSKIVVGAFADIDENHQPRRREKTYGFGEFPQRTWPGTGDEDDQICTANQVADDRLPIVNRQVESFSTEKWKLLAGLSHSDNSTKLYEIAKYCLFQGHGAWSQTGKSSAFGVELGWHGERCLVLRERTEVQHVRFVPELFGRAYGPGGGLTPEAAHVSAKREERGSCNHYGDGDQYHQPRRHNEAPSGEGRPNGKHRGNGKGSHNLQDKPDGS